LSIFVLFSSISIALQFPTVQTYVVHKTTDYISDLLDYPISIEYINISWFDNIQLKKVSVEDRNQNQMIYVDDATINFNLNALLGSVLTLDELTLRNGKVKVYKTQADTSDNLAAFIATIKKLTKPKKPRGKPKTVLIKKVKLENMFFGYYDKRKALIKDRFDYHHFKFDNINASITNFKVIADTLQIDVTGLNATERQTKLKIKNTDVLFTVSKYNMLFQNTSAHIGKSYVKTFLRLDYKDVDDLSSFNTKVKITARIDSSRMYSKDLGQFIPVLKPYNDYAAVKGNISGNVVNFDVNNLYFQFGRNSLVKGNGSFKGLPNVQETYTNFQFHNSSIKTTDLKQYFPTASYAIIKKFGSIKGTGEFVGFPYDFVAHGKFTTGLGKLDSDINFKILEKATVSSLYSGHLKTYGFNLGKFLNVPDKVGLIDMDGSLKGSGLTLANAVINLDAKISRIGINHYDYQNITTNAKLSDELFDGFISVADSNLVFTANGLINLKKNINRFNIRANFEKANLKPLHITDRKTFAITSFDLNFTGIKPDEIVGEVKFSNSYLLYEDSKEIFIDTLYARSTKQNDIRNFYLNSNLLGVNATGNFEFTDLYSDIITLVKEYKLNFKNDKAEIAAYYKKKRKETKQDKYSLDFAINVKNLNKIFNVYAPGLYLSPNTKIEGDFSHGSTVAINTSTHIDTLFYKEHEIYNSDLELSTSKFADSANVLGMVYAQSPSQALRGFPQTENFFFQGIWNKSNIDFQTSIKQKNSNNNIDLKGILSLAQDKQQILQLKNSSFSILNKTWNINNKNRISFSNEGILFNDFSVINDQQLLFLKGMLSTNPEKEAFLDIQNFELQTLNPLLEKTSVSGITNGSLTIKNIFKAINFTGNLNVDSLKVQGFLIGNVKGESAWDSQKERLDIHVNVVRENENIIGLAGFVKNNEEQKTQDLNLSAVLNKARLDILNPLMGNVLSNIGGTATGTFNISGNTHNVVLKGKAAVEKGTFKINYLNTTYFFDDFIYLDENMIGFKNLRLKDDLGNTAIVNGGIYHDNFRDFVLNLKANADNFKVLNTTEKDNAMFYGTAIVSGDIELLGAFNDFAIKANAVSKKGTRIFIPISDAEAYEKENFIHFTSKKEQAEASDSNKVNLSGIRMDFNLEITPDAYAEIIFDKRAGDIIRGNGYGNLKLEIDTRGDFNLYGKYNMVKGAYNFTLANLINKEFTIAPNSSISWYGNPYAGILDIDAVYQQSASLKPLIINYDDVLADKEGYKRSSVDVLLGLKGKLLSPNIDLGIKIRNYSGEAATYVAQFENSIQTNEQELNRQVFSLLVLGGFSAPSSFAGIAADPTSNLSELLTNQLGNWLSQVDQNLQIDMDLRGMDREALNTFNLRLSYTFLDGRLRVSRDGRFTNVQDDKQSNFSNIAGEWTIEYLLSPDGKLRLKLYNKNNQNQIATGMANPTSTSAGFSLLHTQSFNNIAEIFTKKKPTETDSGKTSNDSGKVAIPAQTPLLKEEELNP